MNQAKRICLWASVILLSVLFAYAGISKLADYQRFVRMLGRSPYVFMNPWILGWSLPVMEIIVSAILWVPKIRFYGLYGSFILMLVFTAYIAFMLAFAPHLSCSCGGVLQRLGWKPHLWFNAFFTLLALFGLLIEHQRRQFLRPQHISAESGFNRTPV